MTNAPFTIAHVLDKERQQVQDLELIKESLSAVAKSLFEGVSNKRQIAPDTNDFQLSGSKIKRRVQDITNAFHSPLSSDVYSRT